MAIRINLHVVSDQEITDEEKRLGGHPSWMGIPDQADRAERLRFAAENSLIDQVLIKQQSDKDTRPVDPEIIEAEMKRASAAYGCREAADEPALRAHIEARLRIQRTMRELAGPDPEIPGDAARRFFDENHDKFDRPESARAAHIVRHVGQGSTREEALAGIQLALGELKRGAPFAEVAERHSDCKGNGGDLGLFERGHMVPEFDQAVFKLKPGERSGIFETAFGFHIAEVRERVAGGLPPIDKVLAEIKKFLLAMEQHRALTQAIQLFDRQLTSTAPSLNRSSSTITRTTAARTI